MGISISTTLILGWKVTVEEFRKPKKRFDPDTGQEMEPVQVSSHTVFRIGSMILSSNEPGKEVNPEIVNDPSADAVYAAGDFGLFNSGDEQSYCYGQIVHHFHVNAGGNDKTCNKLYPLPITRSTALIVFQSRYNLPDPELFGELSVG